MKKTIRNWSQMADWGHYNRKYINAVMHKDELFEIRTGIERTDGTRGSDCFTWSGIQGNPSFDYYTEARVEHMGPVSLTGGYSLLTLRYEDFVFDLSFACGEAGFVYKLSPVTFSRLYRFTIGFFVGSRLKQPIGAVVPGDHGFTMINHRTGSKIEVYVLCGGMEIRENTVLADAAQTVYITDMRGASAERLEEMISEAHRREEALCVRGTGYLGGETVPSMIWAAGWNKVYDHMNGAFQIDVSRLWAPESCYYSFYWDNLLDALPAALRHKESAYDQFESICSEFKNGYLPQCCWEWGSSSMINPPIGSYCLWKLYRQFGEIEPLKLYFPYFYETNRVLSARKSDAATGLITLLGPEGADRVLKVSETSEAMEGALATGLDNSPMYAEKENFIDVGMSSVYALDCLCLSMIAGELGDAEKCAEMKNAYEKAASAINMYLWDEDNGIYCNRGLDGSYKTVYTPTSFYPMLACDIPEERLVRLVRGHLLNPTEFWGEYVIPSVDKRHPSYQKQDYWEGCAWAPMNFLVYEGLRSRGQYDAASMLAGKSTDMYAFNRERFGWVLENYSTVTGSITPNCVPMYTWGTLMAYTGVQELIRMSMSGIEFGSFMTKEQGIVNIPVRGHSLSVFTGEGIRIEADGVTLLKTDVPAVIKLDLSGPSRLRVLTRGSGTITTDEGISTLREGETEVPFGAGRAYFS